jgi:S-DNA-T family DNA segregation ATPase FtsK/SpoIIIE
MAKTRSKRPTPTRKPSPPRPPLAPETKGLILLLGVTLSLFSAVSFRLGHEELNWLGLLGYRYALGLFWVLGWGAYLLFGYFAWQAWRLLHSPHQAHGALQHTAFGIGLASLCFLLNIFVESWPQLAGEIRHLCWSQSFMSPVRGLGSLDRIALGGQPTYLILKDIPYLNLLRVLSPVGCTLVFSLTLAASVLLLADMNLADLGLQLRQWWARWLEQRAQKRRLEPALLGESAPPAKRTAVADAGLYRRPEAAAPPAPSAAPKEVKPVIKIAPTPEPSRKESAIQAQRVYNGEFEHYKLPSSGLLRPVKTMEAPHLKRELTRQAQVLEETLGSFGIDAKVGEIHCGPTIAQFEVHPAVGVKVQRIKALENDIALNMQARSVRILTPIPGKAAVGVEIPSPVPVEVSFAEILAAFASQPKRPEIPMMLGKTVTGEIVIGDLAKMPHCIIAGATGSGKSVCLNTIIMSILMTARPDEIRMLMVDPKKVELTHYSELPHMLAPVITDAQDACSALYWLVKEMEQRYEMLRRLQVRNISAFNARQVDEEKEAKLAEDLGREIPKRLPYYVGIIDELADLMMVANSDIETPIARIAQMARAVGIHLIVATQRPSREVITGLIKANFPTRIAFKVASRINSQIILDDVGAEMLLGNGDMLYLPPGTSQLIRAQGCYVADEEINRIISRVCEQAPAQYVMENFAAYAPENLSGKSAGGAEGSDPLFEQATQLCYEAGAASTTYLQRKLKIGYARAASLMDELEQAGIVGPADGAKPRKVIRPLD